MTGWAIETIWRSCSGGSTGASRISSGVAGRVVYPGAGSGTRPVVESPVDESDEPVETGVPDRSGVSGGGMSSSSMMMSSGLLAVGEEAGVRSVRG
jgi:hypothetical protein